jgi:hypothetical protein
MDATWFTTFIRSEEFAVGANTGGFFRLQPCGKDLKDRKLIWVLPFTKHGYTRKAKVLSDPHRNDPHRNDPLQNDPQQKTP